jgi:two-component system response regulator FixJ
MPGRSTVCVIDDDPDVGEVTRRIIESRGVFDCRQFSAADQFLGDLPRMHVNCVVTDLRMPGISGDELLARLAKIDPDLAVVIVSAYADVPTAVRVMEQGAATLLQKPFTSDQLISAVERGVTQTNSRRAHRTELKQAEAILSGFSAEELSIMDCMVSGLPNKSIAQKLTLSARTLDRRRQHILQSLGVSTVPELASLITRLRTATN